MSHILETTKYVVDNSKDVSINQDNLKKASSQFEPKAVQGWADVAPFKYTRLSNEKELAFLFITNCLNFSYWGDPKWTVEYQGKKLDGAFGMLAALRRALEENIPILDALYLETLTSEQLSHILRGNVEIPLFQERLNILRDVGATLKQKYDGNVVKVIEAGQQDVLKLLEILTTDFSNFDDTATYNGKKIYFYKRAQLAISDMYRIFKGEGYGKFHNIQELTAFADYKIPQIMRKLGILEYSPQLTEKVDNKIELPAGSPEEVEIRANMVWGIELMKQELESKISNIMAMDIDACMWLQGQDKSSSSKPYHRTRTTAY